MKELRDFLIVILLGFAILIAVDQIWFGGRYLDLAKQEYGLDISAVRRR
jgi:hypothetical protein